MNTPISEIFIRLGWAFLCGFLIFMVPLLLRKSWHGETRGGRITAAVFAFLFFASFCAFAWFLWDKYVPKDDAEDARPAALPVAPATSLSD